MLHKEYFDCPQRDSHAMYITFKMGGGGGQGSLYSCTRQSCNRVVLHRPLCGDSEKIPVGTTSTYILHLSGKSNKRRKGNSPRTPASRPGPSPHWAVRGPSSPTRRAWGPPQPRSWRPVHTVTYIQKPLHWQARWQVVSALRNTKISPRPPGNIHSQTIFGRDIPPKYTPL